MTTRAVLRWSSKTAPIRLRHPTRSVPGSPDGAPDANAAGTGPSSTRAPSGPTTNTLMLPRPSSAGVAPSGNATSTPCFPGCRGTMTVDDSSEPGTTSSRRRQQNPWKGAGSTSKINAEPRSSAGRREGDAVGVTEVVSGRGTRRARRRHGPAEGSANRPENGQAALPAQGPRGGARQRAQALRADRVALVVSGRSSTATSARGEALRDAETFCAPFADNARWFSPFRYEVGEGKRSQFGPVVLGNSVEGGFFAVDDDRVGGVYVGDED